AHRHAGLDRHEDSSALGEDAPLRVLQHLAVLGLQGEVFGDPGLVERPERLGMLGAELDDLHGRTRSRWS
ncbi:hypothetical protein, partial [Phenylobacterium sp.]|uniref:hypothetical protein n=1 Tax=Phenylobacterium sp. TaxID=1871053 RepID=UPI00286A677B